MVSQTEAPGAAFTSLSSNEVIQFILADIPIFTVGILAFGTFTFFFLMKRVDRWVFCLHMAVIAGFLAALLDISQLLLQGRTSSDSDGSADGTVSPEISSLDTAREVFYSFSNGLRFLFYWGFAAMIPAGETIPEGNDMHSGSWRRWGMVGIILKLSSLLLVVTMTILQIVYRTVPALRTINPVYETEAALEIILSAVFILKLLLNTWARFAVGTASQTKGKMLVQYAPIIVALLFSMWIAVGNSILFEFTETVLGRFMRAVELYITLVYILVVSFHHLRHLSFFPVYRPASKPISRSNTFRNSIEKGGELSPTNAVAETNKINLAEVLEEQYRNAQQVPPTVERNSARSAKVEDANQHQSMIVRLSTWMGVARPLPRPPQPVNPQSWEVDQERGISPVTPDIAKPWYPSENRSQLDTLSIPGQPEIDEDEQRGVSPIPEYDYVITQTENYDVAPSRPTSGEQDQQVDVNALTPVDTSTMESETTSEPKRDWQEVEFSNAARYSGVDNDVVAYALQQRQPYQPPERSPSMISNIQVISPPSDQEYSRANSIMNEDQDPASPYPASPLASAAATPLARSRPLPPMPVRTRFSQLASPVTPMPDSARSSNMSILLRQQNELDQSIAALRLFSPSKAAFDAHGQAVSALMDREQYMSGEQSWQPSPSLDAARLEMTPSPELPLPLTTPRPNESSPSPGQSEYHFDTQPPLNRSSMDSGVIPMPTYQSAVSSPAGSPAPQLIPPRMPVSRFSDVSSASAGSRARRVDSLGTQYDITSFVGNLTVPTNPKDSILSWSSNNTAEEGAVGIATIARPPFARPQLIAQAPRQLSTVSSTLEPSVEPSTELPGRSPSGRALPAIPQPASQTQTLQPDQSAQPGPPRFRRAVGLPPRPRLSVRNLTPVEERVTSPSDTATLVTSPQNGSGTPVTGKAW